MQYVEETAGSYGVTPDSPTLLHAGPIVDLNDNQEQQAIKYRQIGSRDIYGMIRTGKLCAFDITFNPINDDLLQYGMNLPGVSSKNVGKSLTFMKSQLVDGTEKFQVYKGARVDTVDYSITNDGAQEVSMGFLCKSISTPASTHGFTGTTTFGTNPSTFPWTNLTSGSQPLTWNGTNQYTPSFSVSVANNLQRVKPNGESEIMWLEPTLRDISVEFDTYYHDTLVWGEHETLTPRELLYKLSSNRRIKITGATLENLSTSDSTSSTDPKMLSFSGTGTTIAVEAY